MRKFMRSERKGPEDGVEDEEREGERERGRIQLLTQPGFK
jgi:hypothetical protein